MPHVEILWQESKLITDLYFFKTGLPEIKSFRLEHKTDTVNLFNGCVKYKDKRVGTWRGG